MKRLISILIAAIMLVSMMSVLASAEQLVAYADKTPITTPNFKPTIDGVKDDGYTSTYTIEKVADGVTDKFAHTGGSKVSTAWYENTLYFYVEVPDTTPQESIADIWNYQRDGVWFLLYFGGDFEEPAQYTKYKKAKVFKVYPKVEQVNFEGATFQTAIEPVLEEDLAFKVVYGDAGYTIEIAYTVPEKTAALAANAEIAFDMEVYDMNSDKTYRYFLANPEENSTENYCSAWGAKLVLQEAVAVPPVVGSSDDVGSNSPDTNDSAVALAVATVVALGAIVVAKKKN